MSFPSVRLYLTFSIYITTSRDKKRRSLKTRSAVALAIIITQNKYVVNILQTYSIPVVVLKWTAVLKMEKKCIEYYSGLNLIAHLSIK